MRIAYDATPAARQRAGVGRYARELLGALLALPDDDRYMLACAATPDEVGALLASLPAGAWREPRRLPLGERYLTIAWQRARMPLRVEALIGPFDVFHGTDFVTPPSARPRVVTVHDLSFLHAPEFGEPSLVAYLRAAVPRALASARRVIAVSASVASEVIAAYPWTRERVVAIPNGVRIPESPPRRGESTRPTVLAVGTLEPRKDLPTLLRAMRIVRGSFPDAQLVVAGRIGWRADDIVREVREAEAHEDALFVEAPDDATLDDLYARASVVATAARYEGFGLSVLEAMARGVPVVASDIPALRETGGDAARYAEPTRPEAFAERIIELLDHAELREHVVAAGLTRATAFSWHETARRTRRVYAQAAEDR